MFRETRKHWLGWVGRIKSELPHAGVNILWLFVSFFIIRKIDFACCLTLNSPVAVLSVHTDSAIEAGASGIRGAGLMGLLSARAGAHGRGFHRNGHKAHSPTIHHGRRVSHIQNVGAAAGPGTLRTGTLVHPDLENADLEKRLELDGERRGRWKKISKTKWLFRSDTAAPCKVFSKDHSST